MSAEPDAPIAVDDFIAGNDITQCEMCGGSVLVSPSPLGDVCEDCCDPGDGW